MARIKAARRVGAPQPKILSTFRDAEGRFHVIDEQGETVIEPGLGPDQHGQGSTFGVNVDWQGGTAEIRWHSDDDIGNNRSYLWVGLYAHTSGFTTYGNAWFNIRCNGDGYTGGNVSIGSGWVLIAARDSWVGHNADGNQIVEVGVVNGEVQGTSFNNAWGTQQHYLTNYVVLPFAPQNVKVRAGTVQTTSFGVEYTRNSYDAIDQDQAQWSTNSGFTAVVWTDNGPAGYTNPKGVAGAPALTPGTTHWVRIRSHTSRGWGPWSAAVSQTTLPAVPPGMSVVASPSGTSATVTLTPPGGVTGVTEYIVERRTTGTTSPITEHRGSSPVVVSGLTPGAQYDWRASAMIGTYESPQTGWLTVQQPNPNTSPGDYFDGSTPDKPDIDYGWTGTPNNSTSQATGKGVTGWQAGAFTNGAGSLYQTTGGFSGSFAARLAFTRDTTTAGAWSAGMASSPLTSLAEVEPDTPYVGSIYVNPSREQRLALSMYWYDDAGANTNLSVTGEQVIVPPGVWTRLTVSGTAPGNAGHALLRVKDWDGAGFVTFKSGDFLLLDGAMVTLTGLFDYFDGNTPDTADFTYDWVGAENASVSSRTTNEVVGGFDPLDDPDCPPLPSPPRPPVVPSDCIDEVGVWRRYWATIPEEFISDWLAVIPTIAITTGAEEARQVRIRVYENPDNLDPDDMDTSVWHSEQIVSYIPPKTVITLDGVSQRTWAEVNGGDSRPADKLVYGTGGTPATWPILSCGLSYLLSFDAPLEAAAGNLTIALALTERMG